MRKNKLTLVFTLLLLLSLSTTFAQQDWTTNSSKLYYHNGTEKVFIQPFNTAAIYFESLPRINQLAELIADFPQFSISEEKLMMVLESNQSFEELKTMAGRQAFLERYDLTALSGYDALPGFLVNDGYPAWFTQKITIRLENSVSMSTVRPILREYGASVLENVRRNIYIIEVPALEEQLPLIQELHEEGLIQWGQPDFRVSLEHTNDPLYPEQYQMNNTGAVIDGQATVADIDIDAPEAWAITKGNTSLKVAVVDDGLESHEDLPTIVGGFTPLNNGNGGVVSGSDHGVACAGIIAGQHDNSIGVRGVSPNVQLQSINIFAGNESTNDLADAFYWAIDNDSDVLSNSWGFTTFFGLNALCDNNPYPALTDAINDAAVNGRNGKGCVIIFASGNQNDCVTYPGRLASVVAVGAISPTGNRSSYSNFGPELDVVAPSSDGAFGVRTTDREGGAGYTSGNYTPSFGGTSAATPAVAGVGALILAIDNSLTGPEVHDILENTADDMGTNGFDNTFGYGRVNAHEAVLAAQGGGSGCTPGSACDDGDVCTINDVLDANCNCAGTFVDADNDGFCVGDDPNDNDKCVPDASDPSCNTGGGNCGTTIDSNDFESGLGIWNTGGNDARRNSSDAAFANSGSFCVRLRDNSGAASSIFTDNLSAASYQSLEVSFSYIVNSFEGSEDFFLEVSTNGGSSYSLVEEWNLGDEFQNGIRYNETVTVNAALNNNTVLRFRCDATANNDRLYLDDIVIKGCGDGGSCTPGAACDDGDVCTTNDVLDANCNCAGTFVDTDNDGFCVGDDPDDNDQCVPDDSDPACGTGGGGSCAAPDGLFASAITKRRATLNWNGVSSATDYEVQIRPVGNSSWDDFSTTDTDIRISGLPNRTTHEWRVRANCGGDISAWSVTCEFTTGTSSSGGCGAGLADTGNTFAAAMMATPNPVQQELTVQLNLAQPATLRLLDLVGRTVFSASVAEGYAVQYIDVRDLPKGLYLLQVESMEEIIIEKIVVE